VPVLGRACSVLYSPFLVPQTFSETPSNFCERAKSPTLQAVSTREARLEEAFRSGVPRIEGEETRRGIEGFAQPDGYTN
jgi:hypothetical protein